jgi:hypothetical protein
MREQACATQAWAKLSIRSAAAIVLMATMLIPMEAGAFSSDRNQTDGASHRVVTFGATDEGWRTNEPDPTDDGSIIIECVVFDGAVPTATDMPRRDLTHLMALPQFPLGPTKCWPREYKRT